MKMFTLEFGGNSRPFKFKFLQCQASGKLLPFLLSILEQEKLIKVDFEMASRVSSQDSNYFNDDYDDEIINLNSATNFVQFLQPRKNCENSMFQFKFFGEEFFPTKLPEQSKLISCQFVASCSSNGNSYGFT